MKCVAKKKHNFCSLVQISSSKCVRQAEFVENSWADMTEFVLTCRSCTLKYHIMSCKFLKRMVDMDCPGEVGSPTKSRPNRPYHGFRRHLDGWAKRQKLQYLYEKSMTNIY